MTVGGARHGTQFHCCSGAKPGENQAPFVEVVRIGEGPVRAGRFVLVCGVKVWVQL